MQRWGSYCSIIVKIMHKDQIEEPTMSTMCAIGIHLIQKLPNGQYICVYQCGMTFQEHWEIVIAAGVAAAPKTR